MFTHKNLSAQRKGDYYKIKLTTAGASYRDLNEEYQTSR